MDVLDHTDGHFFHLHFPDDWRYASLGNSIAYHRTSRFSDDPNNARDKIFFGFARECLYPSSVARINGFGVVDRVYYFIGLDNYRYALGVNAQTNQAYRVYIAGRQQPSRWRYRLK
jgi:hypothetical protein